MTLDGIDLWEFDHREYHNYVAIVGQELGVSIQSHPHAQMVIRSHFWEGTPPSFLSLREVRPTLTMAGRGQSGR